MSIFDIMSRALSVERTAVDADILLNLPPNWETVLKAERDPDVLELERRGWLRRRVNPVRYPDTWWEVTDRGRSEFGKGNF